MCAFDPKDQYAMNVYLGSYLDEGFDKHALEVWGVEKFDVIVMNPPYNSGNTAKGSILWDKFVLKTLSQLVEAGYLVAVHPDGWRKFEGKQKRIQLELRKRQLLYLEIHDKNDGMKTFGAYTTYDFYCLRNVSNTMFTKIVCQDGTIERVDLSKMEFIPNGMFEKFEEILAKDGEEKVNMSLERYAYGTQKEYMSKEQTDEFQYPIMYLTYKDGSHKCWYSNRKDNGHFGIPKIIFTNGISTPIIDETGEYGMTEFAYGIVDEPKNLFYIKRAMENPEFIELMGFVDGATAHTYNRKAIALFRKNFWEEFQPA